MIQEVVNEICDSHEKQITELKDLIKKARNILFDLEHMLPKNSITEDESKRISSFIMETNKIVR